MDFSAIMDRDGFLPKGLVCLFCGVELQGQGSGRPAESYLGTYNGLCYPCTGKPAFIEQIDADGFEVWTHPPSCPSWRRDRERFYRSPGCRECTNGAHWITRASIMSAEHRRHCRSCLALRAWREKLATFRRDAWKEAHAIIDGLDTSAEKKRKGRKLTAADASELFLPMDIAEKRRRVLREVWSLPPEAWSFVRVPQREDFLV